MTKLIAGMDLHSNNVVIGLMDMDGKRVAHQKVVLSPFKKRLEQVAVESTYNWYWLVDGLQKLRYPVVLANPAGMEQYSGTKHGRVSDGFGVVTGFMAIWFGACGGTFGAWRWDRGLWMLSALFLTIALLCHAGFTYGHISDIIHHRGGIAGMIDLSFGISLLWMQSRFLLTVTASNW